MYWVDESSFLPTGPPVPAVLKLETGATPGEFPAKNLIFHKQSIMPGLLFQEAQNSNDLIRGL